VAVWLCEGVCECVCECARKLTCVRCACAWRVFACVKENVPVCVVHRRESERERVGVVCECVGGVLASVVEGVSA